eukprot:1137998-Pelagomonas_calceolata.AAC.4
MEQPRALAWHAWYEEHRSAQHTKAGRVEQGADAAEFEARRLTKCSPSHSPSAQPQRLGSDYHQKCLTPTSPARVKGQHARE